MSVPTSENDGIDDDEVVVVAAAGGGCAVTVIDLTEDDKALRNVAPSAFVHAFLHPLNVTGPILFRGFNEYSMMTGNEGIAKVMEWETDHLIEEWGHVEVPLRSIRGSIFSQFSHQDLPDETRQDEGQRMRIDDVKKLGDFLREDSDSPSRPGSQLFVIGGQEKTPLEKMMNMIPQRLDFLPQRRWNPLLSIQRGGDGVGWHKHALSWLLQISGEKKWKFSRPGAPPSAVSERFLGPPSMWWNDNASLSAARTCSITTARGDLLIIPDRFYHATMNEPGSLNIAVGQQGNIWDGADPSIQSRGAEDYKKLLQFYPSDPSLYQDMALTTKVADESLRYIDKAVSLDPLNFMTQMQSVVLHILHGDSSFVDRRTDELLASLKRLHADGIISREEVHYTSIHQHSWLYDECRDSQEGIGIPSGGFEVFSDEEEKIDVLFREAYVWSTKNDPRQWMLTRDSEA